MAKITREKLLAQYTNGERDFSGLDFSKLVFERCILDGCNFRGANFSYTKFFNWTCIQHCNFRNTTFFRANLSLCAFSGSNFTGANMREVILEGGEGIGVTFENVDFRGCGAIGNFVHERTLCLRNCIGSNGKIIELFNEDTIMEESSRRYIKERYGGTLPKQLPTARLTPIYDIDGIEIPDIPF